VTTVGDLRVVYIPQVPMKAYVVELPSGYTLEQAKVVLDAVVGLSIFEFENKVKPDYSDCSAIERWELDSGDDYAWFWIDEEEYEED